MSHLPERKEKNCLNCGTTVIGKYCHVCGQENLDPKESVWHLITHFFNDITHFDGKFFTTMKDLVFKPGFLSKEYMVGRRARYLNPIRMYLFTSFIFFLIFFSFFHFSEQPNLVKAKYYGKTTEQLQEMSPDEFDAFTRELNNGNPMSREGFTHFVDSVNNEEGLFFTKFDKPHYKTKEEYDSLIKTGKLKHNWFVNKLVHEEFKINAKYGKDQKRFFSALMEAFIHSFPQLLFVSLPIIAFILKLLYIRRKKFFFVSNAVFTLHFYIFVFLAMLVAMGISKIETLKNFGWAGYLNMALAGIVFLYLYKAMRNFYEQRRGKTILKYFIILLSFSLVISFLMVIFLFVSIFKV